MFAAVGHALEGDHLDLSFRETSAWTKVGPGEGMPPSLFVNLGDPVSGPDIHLAAVPAPPEDFWLPTHYHGTDQFRAIIRGRWNLQRKQLEAGDFGYQISGVPYREGPGSAPDELWMFAVHGEWRGARSTKTRNDGIEVPEIGEDQLDRYVDSPDYWDNVPGGSKGIVGLASTLGGAAGGFSWGSFDDGAGWQELSPGVSVTAGLLSDRAAGPIILTLRSEAGRTVVPSAGYDTEIVLAIVRGSCRVGDRTYIDGEVRIQKAGTVMDTIIAGADGLDAVLMIADRRCHPQIAASDTAAYWPAKLGELTEELTSSMAEIS